MATEEDREAARSLAAVARLAVVRTRGGDPAARTIAARGWSWLLARVDRVRGTEHPGTAWRDFRSRERPGWRERAAQLGGNEVFRVDYQVCHRCRLGWVEQPSTVAEYRRCGLAMAALAALRSENPGIEWHTLGGHLADSVPFWVAVGAGIPGGYTQRDRCPHRGGDPAIASASVARAGNRGRRRG
ncbi:MAG TPA: hypothetical protein VI365_13665 [Trebonia sp.]